MGAGTSDRRLGVTSDFTTRTSHLTHWEVQMKGPSGVGLFRVSTTQILLCSKHHASHSHVLRYKSVCFCMRCLCLRARKAFPRRPPGDSLLPNIGQMESHDHSKIDHCQAGGVTWLAQRREPREDLTWAPGLWKQEKNGEEQIRYTTSGICWWAEWSLRVLAAQMSGHCVKNQHVTLVKQCLLLTCAHHKIYVSSDLPLRTSRSLQELNPGQEFKVTGTQSHYYNLWCAMVTN